MVLHAAGDASTPDERAAENIHLLDRWLSMSDPIEDAPAPAEATEEPSAADDVAAAADAAPPAEEPAEAVAEGDGGVQGVSTAHVIERASIEQGRRSGCECNSSVHSEKTQNWRKCLIGLGLKHRCSRPLPPRACSCQSEAAGGVVHVLALWAMSFLFSAHLSYTVCVRHPHPATVRGTCITPTRGRRWSPPTPVGGVPHTFGGAI